MFGAAPRELLRSVSLTQTLQLIRITVEVVEERVKNDDAALREAILKYSREIAFAAADVYARAAEQRGLWDARLEALVVDSILSGEYDNELPSRIAALGWNGHGEVCVLVGTAPRMLDVDHLRRTARHLDADVLIGVQGSRLVLVIGRASPVKVDDEVQPLPFLSIAEQLESGFGPGHLVLGPEVASLVEASRSAKAALAGFAVARSWRNAPRPDPRRRPAARARVRRAIRWRARPSSTASTSRCRRTRPTCSRPCGATSTTGARSKRLPASSSCTRTPCATASSGSAK